MNDPNGLTVTPIENTSYEHDKKKPVFQVLGDPVRVKPHEVVEIVMASKEGFRVCFPFEGHFDSQVYEAEENPEWAKKKMKAVDGSDSQTLEKPLWGVRMKRISEAGAFPKKIFPYCVYSYEHKNFLVGNSPPKMNLDP